MAEAERPSPPGVLSSFAQLPHRFRLAMMVSLAALVAGGVGLAIWARTPEYRPLYGTLAESDGGAVVAALDQLHIPHRYSEGGTILVPVDRLHEGRLKLAAQGLPRGGTAGFELMENPRLGMTQFQEQVNYQRALEGELARSIQSLAAVQTARVHLAIPKPSVFLRERQVPSASVVVRLQPGRTLDAAQVDGIVNLVASSIPELAARNVSVVDHTGVRLSHHAQGLDEAQASASRLAFVGQIEANAIRRIHDILEPIVGRANVRAQVNAEVDFGPTDSPPSVSPPTTGAAAGERSANGRPAGTLRRLSVAVVVNHRRVADPTGRVAYVPLPEREIAQLTALVKEAVGYDERRGDTLDVANAAFAREAAEVAPEAESAWQRALQVGGGTSGDELARGLGLSGLALLVLAAALRPVLGREAREARARRRIEASPERRGPGALEERLAALRTLARKDPAAVASVVRRWVSEHD